jgi:hypothetical protein
LRHQELRQRRKAETEKDYIKKLTAEFCIRWVSLFSPFKVPVFLGICNVIYSIYRPASSTLKHINILETVDLLQDEQGRWCEIMEVCGSLYSFSGSGLPSP